MCRLFGSVGGPSDPSPAHELRCRCADHGGVTKTFVRYQSAAGLRPFRLHDLRHFMATQMLDLGVPVTVVARRLDHRRVSTTLDFSSHVITGRDRFAAEGLAPRAPRFATGRAVTGEGPRRGDVTVALVPGARGVISAVLREGGRHGFPGSV